MLRHGSAMLTEVSLMALCRPWEVEDRGLPSRPVGALKNSPTPHLDMGHSHKLAIFRNKAATAPVLHSLSAEHRCGWRTTMGENPISSASRNREMEPTSFYNWPDFQARRKDLSAAFALMLGLAAILTLAGEWWHSNNVGPIPAYQFRTGAIPILNGIGMPNRNAGPEDEHESESEDAGANSRFPDD
jgi:hypothetical protein